MRVLVTTWADPWDPERRSGGIGVYLRALLPVLAAQDGVEVAVLSAGLAHDLRPAPPRVERLPEDGPGGVARHQMVNSGLVAPSHADFGGAAQLAHAPTEAAFAAFLAATGPWDVIHVHTLEGLPAGVLARTGAARVVLSLHNYYPLCPQVNLWHAERAPCTDFEGGARCVSCLPATPDPRAARLALAVGGALARRGAPPGSLLHDRVFRPALGLGWRTVRRVAGALRRRGPPRPPPVDRAAHFAQRRARMLALIDAHAAQVLCVSDRVRQIALAHGMDPARLTTLRIGSAEAVHWTRTAPRPAFLREDGTLRLAFLGYMRRDKGFFALMQALLDLPADQAARLHLTVAARAGEAQAMALLAQLRGRLASMRHVDGYTPADLGAILADVDLGVVPVLWEDNLPQVALEMHARHIPVMTSDRGGARELAGSDALVFRAGDSADFARVLGRVLDGSLHPDAYWQGARAPVDMDTHARALLTLYRGLA